MAGKKLEELSRSELSTELYRASIFGAFSEAEAVVRLTVFLVKNKENPFSFKFFPCNIPVADDVPKEDGEDEDMLAPDVLQDEDMLAPDVLQDEDMLAPDVLQDEDMLAPDDLYEGMLVPDDNKQYVGADKGMGDIMPRGIGVSKVELADIRYVHFMGETQHGGNQSAIALLLESLLSSSLFIRASHLSSNVADTIVKKVRNLCSMQPNVCRHSIWPPDLGKSLFLWLLEFNVFLIKMLFVRCNQILQL